MKPKKILLSLLTAFISTLMVAQQKDSTSTPPLDTIRPGAATPAPARQELPKSPNPEVKLVKETQPIDSKQEKLQQAKLKQEKWNQYLIANQIYIAMSSNLSSLIMETAEKVRDEATADKNMLWVARANFCLGIYAFQYRRIGLAEQYWKNAVESYKKSNPESPKEMLAWSREKELANLALAQLHALVPTSDPKEMEIAKKDMERKQKIYDSGKKTPIPLLVQIFEVNLEVDTFKRPIRDSDDDIEKASIDLVRVLGFYAIKDRSVPQEQTDIWMQRVINWYYEHKVKSPEIHAFEVWYDDFPEKRKLYEITLKNNSKWNFSRSSDKEGNYYGYVPDTLHRTTESLKDVAEERERIELIYKGLIHPNDAGKWMILHLDECEKKAYAYAQLRFLKANDKLGTAYEAIDYNDSVEISKINFRDQEMLISGNMASAVAILSKPFSVHSAILPVPDMRDFKDRIKELYKQLDTNWVLNNPNISNSTQTALLGEIRNLIVLYPDEAVFEKEFKKFSALVRKLQDVYKSKSYKSNIQLSRRGYLGVYLGLDLDNTKSLGWWLTLLKDNWKIANANSLE